MFCVQNNSQVVEIRVKFAMLLIMGFGQIDQLSTLQGAGSLATHFGPSMNTLTIQL